MNITEYLKSEQARADVGAQIRELGNSKIGDLWFLGHVAAGAWRKIEIWSLDNDLEPTTCIAAYFRPDADRFIVTDLGEAVHAQRLRTGRMRTDDDCEECYQDSEVIFHRCALHARVDQVSLSAAICRVMFAAYEVARL